MSLLKLILIKKTRKIDKYHKEIKKKLIPKYGANFLNHLVLQALFFNYMRSFFVDLYNRKKNVNSKNMSP